MSDEQQPTSRDLVNQLVERGMTKAEIARELGVSSRMVTAVQKGERPGRNYLTPLSELASRGRVEHPPERRRTASGDLAKVRGSGGEAVTPAPVPPKQPRAGHEAHTTYLPGKQRLHTVQAPKSEGKGREQARQDILDWLRAAARGKRHVGFTITYDNGAQVEVGRKGGYRASAALFGSRSEGDDPFEWLDVEAEGAGYEDLIGGSTAVSVSLRVW